MIRISLFFTAALLILFAGDRLESGMAQEIYYYEAVPEGDRDGGRKEFIKMEFISRNDGLEYIAEIKSDKGIENIKIKMERGAGFVSGTREVLDLSDRQVSSEKIWRDEDSAYLQRNPVKGKTSKIIKYNLYNDRMLAVDGSLLALFRYFKFEYRNTQDIFMIDFSGTSVSVTVRQAGIENIAVPPGAFECYRIEVIVNIPLIRPKIIYWVTKDEPHFMVKHKGKRGPFTTSYATYLVKP